MALAKTIDQVWHDGQRLHVLFTVTPSGSYVSGGDALDLSDSLIPGGEAPDWVEIHGEAGFPYEYVIGANLAAGLMKVRVNTTAGANNPLPEHTAASYVAGVSGDAIKGHAIFRFGR